MWYNILADTYLTGGAFYFIEIISTIWLWIKKCFLWWGFASRVCVSSILHHKERFFIMPKGHKTTPAEYHKLAQEKGIKWLGPEVKNNQTKTQWQCKSGHIWWATYATVYQKVMGCRQCYEDSMRHTDEDYYQLALENGFEWLGPSVKKNIHKTKWCCKNGHIFSSTYSSIQLGNGCMRCRDDRLRLKPEDYHNLAISRGYQWLGPFVERNIEPTQWQCSCGNIWMASYNNISRGRSCPKCRNMVNGAQASQAQIDLALMIGGELNYPVNNRHIDVLIVRDGIKIAIEYDTWYWHGHKQDEDRTRGREIIDAGYKLLSIKSNAKLPTMQQLNDAIQLLLNGKDYLEIILDDWGKGNLAIDMLKNVNPLGSRGYIRKGNHDWKALLRANTGQ